jgi:hypothetical protein
VVGGGWADAQIIGASAAGNPITGSQALTLAIPSRMARSYPGRNGMQRDLYHTVIANGAYPPQTPQKPMR